MSIVVCYAAYLAVSLAVAAYVSRALFRNGAVFLVSAFHGDHDLAASVNRLLVVGFWLVNAGYILLRMSSPDAVWTPRAALELCADKLGLVLMALGVMHFLNMFVLNAMRRRGMETNASAVNPPATRSAALPGHGRILD